MRKGWLFTEDKLVPIDLIDKAAKDEVRLRPDVADLDQLPPFEETYYVEPGEPYADTYPAGYAAPIYWYPPVGSAWAGYYTGYDGYPVSEYVPFVETPFELLAQSICVKRSAVKSGWSSGQDCVDSGGSRSSP